MKIYIDFDRTLFDCDKFLDKIFTLIDKYKISKEVFKECQNQCKEKGFNPYHILDLVKEKVPFDDKIYYELDTLIRSTSEYLYQDAKEFLEYVKSLNYEIIILTRGNSTYQREKIFNSRLDLWYNKLIVTMKHKGTLKLDYANSIFIDDNPKEIESILTQKPKMVIRIQREKTKYYNEVIKDDVITIKSLQEIMEKGII